MKSLTNKELKKAYLQAKKINLESTFIQQLEKELNKRQIYILKDRQ